MELTVSDPARPEAAPRCLTSPAGFGAAYREVMRPASLRGGEVTFRAEGPDAEEAAHRLADLLALDEPTDADVFGAVWAMRERAEGRKPSD